jgi:hypothetical protein
MLFTERDKKILTFCAIFGSATYDHLARAFDTSRNALCHRLPRLEHQGYLRRVAASDGQREIAVWVVTERGALMTGTLIKAPPLDDIDIPRNWHVTAIALQALAAECTVRTRAELGRAAEKATLGNAMRTGAPVTTAPVVLPDLAVNTAEQTIMCEVRLTGGPEEDWRERLSAYATTGNPPVRVWTDDKRVRDAVADAARALGYVDCRVHRVPPSPLYPSGHRSPALSLPQVAQRAAAAPSGSAAAGNREQADRPPPHPGS